MKILVTGGSGFIGTNLIDYLLKQRIYEIQNIDIAKPKKKEHEKYWLQVDIRNRNDVISALNTFSPEVVIHLAARTDLNGISLQEYDANIGGIVNILDAIENVGTVRRVIFASSMYVCEPGYMPRNFEDYAPHTLYGESKVETEKIIKSHNPQYTWSIVRPTSIWGPWFGEPYNRFFHIVLRHMYFHMGKRACKKTYGYVDNAIYQIISILFANGDLVNRKIFYLGDYEPYDITEWADEIGKHAGIKIPKIPYFCFKIAGWVGDFLKHFGISFPMTSFRLHNMTTDNVHNLEPIKKIAPQLPVSREQGTIKTLEWINSESSRI